MKLSVIIPAFNEESTIGDVIQQVQAVNFPDIEKEIIVVDDGSRDRTGEIAKSRGAILVRHIVNRGVGAALGTGMEAALKRGADVVVTCDADGQHFPEDIRKVAEPVLSGRVDFVIGSRMLNPEGMPVSRRMANHLANFIISILFGVKSSDSQSGLRALSRAAVKKIKLTTSRYEALSEMLAEVRYHRLKSQEVPIKVIYTGYSLSKGQGLRMGLKTLFHLLLSRFAR